MVKGEPLTPEQGYGQLLVLSECIRKTCDKIGALEINHKDGGGTKEQKTTEHHMFYRRIVKGTRKTDDLDVLCRACNAVHFLKLKYGEDFPMEVIWKGN